ncbi:MAG: hypothetical protein ACMG55_13620 [Microcoleus sp.]
MAIVPITDNEMFKSFGPVDGTIAVEDCDGPVFGVTLGAVGTGLFAAPPGLLVLGLGVTVGAGAGFGAGLGVAVEPPSVVLPFVSLFCGFVLVLGVFATSVGRECDALN